MVYLCFTSIHHLYILYQCHNNLNHSQIGDVGDNAILYVKNIIFAHFGIQSNTCNCLKVLIVIWPSILTMDTTNKKIYCNVFIYINTYEYYDIQDIAGWQ